MKNFAYNELVKRNLGYIDRHVQLRIFETRILIAGCGIGSTIAEAAVRMGFRSLILVDGDTVALSNLNRQAFRFEDVGQLKTVALAKNLRSINPELDIQVVSEFMNPENTSSLVSHCDLVLDTIDFLDLPSILLLHDESLRQQKPVISAVAAGWGAGAMYMPASSRKKSWFREFFSVPDDNLEKVTHSELYLEFFKNLAPYLDPTILKAMASALKIMEDGKPCPAPQVSAGAAAVASLVLTMIYRVLSEQEITVAPELILMDPFGNTAKSGVLMRSPK